MDAVLSPPEARQELHPHRWLILGVVGLAQLMVILDATIVNVAMPSIQRSLGFSNVDRQWLITAYSLAFGSLLLLGGRLSDLIGRKTTLQVGLVGFAFASALGGASQSFEMLVIARAIQGAFGAVLAPAALAMVTTTFTDTKERGKAFGIYGSIAGAGAAIGLLLGGILTQYLNWRWTLYVNLIFAAVTFVGVQVLIKRERGVARGGLDLLSTALVSGGLFAIVYGLSHAATVATGATGNVTLATAFNNATTIGCVVGGILLVGLFAYRQTRIAKPMLPMPVVTDRARGGSFLSILLAAAAMFSVFLFLTFYLQTVLGYSPVKAGLAFLPMVVVLSATAATASTKLLPRLGPRPLTPTGMALGVLGMIWFTHLKVGGSYATEVLPGLLISGMAMGLVFATSMNTATYRVPPEYAGAASATVNVTQQVGGSIGTALLSTVSLAAAASALMTSLARNPHATPQAALALQLHAEVHGWTVAFWWAAGLFAIGAVASALILPSGRPVPVQFGAVSAAPELVPA